MVICQFRVLRDIKLKGYMLLYKFDKLIVKLNKDGGLKSEGKNFEPIA